MMNRKEDRDRGEGRIERRKMLKGGGERTNDERLYKYDRRKKQRKRAM